MSAEVQQRVLTQPGEEQAKASFLTRLFKRPSSVAVERVTTDETVATSDDSQDWRDVLWREWRNTRDYDYAAQLLEVIGNQEAGWLATGGLSVLGLICGAFATIVASAVGGLLAGGFDLCLPPWPPTIEGGLLGGCVGLLSGWLFRKRLTWRWLIGCLVPKVAKSDASAAIMVTVFTALPLAVALGLVSGTPAALVIAVSGSTFLGMASGLIDSTRVVAFASAFIALAHGIETGIAGFAVMFLGAVFGALQLQGECTHQHGSKLPWWWDRPSPREVEEALRLACNTPHEGSSSLTAALKFLDDVRQHPRPYQNLLQGLRSGDWKERFIATHTIIDTGGAVVEDLAELSGDSYERTRDAVRWILKGISTETAARLRSQVGSKVCPECVTRCDAIPLRLSFPNEVISYYGCRTCGQSRDFLDCPGDLVAVLDTDSTEEKWEKDGSWFINWFERDGLFDFDRIEIVNANDAEVEQFAIDIGNDTDEYRRSRYKEVRCRVAPGCNLSENTLRILRNTFGSVELSS